MSLITWLPTALTGPVVLSSSLEQKTCLHWQRALTLYNLDEIYLPWELFTYLFHFLYYLPNVPSGLGSNIPILSFHVFYLLSAVILVPFIELHQWFVCTSYFNCLICHFCFSSLQTGFWSLHLTQNYQWPLPYIICLVLSSILTKPLYVIRKSWKNLKSIIRSVNSETIHTYNISYCHRIEDQVRQQM